MAARDLSARLVHRHRRRRSGDDVPVARRSFELGLILEEWLSPLPSRISVADQELARSCAWRAAAFDVLVIGQRGLRARGRRLAPSAPARGWRSRRRARSSRATRRRRRAASRPRSARTTRPRSTPRTSGELPRDGRPRGSSRSSRRRRPAAIHWLEELGVEFTRENGGYRLARCGGATRKRLLQVGDRTGHAITKALRDACRGVGVETLPEVAARARSSRPRTAGARRCGEHEIEAGAVVLAAGGRCYREAEERGELSTNHPGATGEVTQIAVELGAEARDLDALQYHPNGGAWPRDMQGYSIPETTRAYGAVLLNADGEEFTDSLGPRDEVSQAIFDEVENGQGRRDRRTAAPRSTSTRRGSPEADAEISLPYMLRRYRAGGHRPARGADPHLPRAPLPERRPRDRRARARRRSRGSTPAARSPAARTAGTG